jgi:iron complex outermembrane recepter protein
MYRIPPRWAAASLAVLVLCASRLVLSADDAGAGTASPQALQEVVVTSQKYSQNLQKVPVAVTVATGSELVTQGISDVRGLGAVIPAISLGMDYVYTQIDIRGVGTNNDAPALDPAVAFNIDGVYQPKDFGTYGTLFDINRIEVLRGPQGTLYGRNTPGGSINVVTNRPVDQFEASGEIGIGNYNGRREFGVLNVPLSSDFYVRAAAEHVSHDGYLSSGFNDLKSTGARLEALYKPSNQFSLLVAGDYFQDRSLGAHTVIGLPFVDPANPWFDPTSSFGAYSNFASWSTHAELDWTFDSMTLTEIPSFKHVHFNTTDPVVGVFSTGIGTDNSYSNELRLASAAGSGSPLKWVTGFYFYKETYFSYSDYFNPYFSSITTNPDIAEKSWALFGQATYSITPTLSVTAGSRYSDDTKSATGQDQVFIPAFSFPVNTIPDTFDDTWHHVDWKVGLNENLTPRSLLYASISTGYLEGGFNLGSSVGLLPNFRPETLTAYAIGSKNRFLDDTLQINAEAFYYDYNNYIVSEYLTAGAAAGDFALYNAAKTHIYGGEIETRWLASRHDLFNVSLSLLRATYTHFILPVASNGISDFSGYTAMKAPAVGIQAGYRHTWDLGQYGSLQGIVQTHFESSYWTLFDHTPGSAQPSYTKTNLILGYFSPGGTWHIQAFCNNLENSAVIATAAPPNSASGMVPWVHVQEPRTYGIRIGAGI